MGQCMTQLVDKLSVTEELSVQEMTELLKYRNKETTEYLFEKAMMKKKKYYGENIYIRGTIELSNYCKNDCYYCGLRRENRFIPRYRLDEEDVLAFCKEGYEQGIRSFLLQSGEDYHFTEDKVAIIIDRIKKHYPDCAVTLSLGVRPETTYRRWYSAGADRYILSHISANESHYKKLHPTDMSLLRRKQCLWELKEIGYQVGTGFMVGTPYQMIDNVVEDLNFLKCFNPEIVNLVPFLPTMHTKYEKERSGNGEMTLYLMAIVRLMLPRVLLSADPTLENVLANGRRKAIDAGVNEILASIATDDVKEYFNVYNKQVNLRNIIGNEVVRVSQKIVESGQIVKEDRGDYEYPPKTENKYAKIHRIM